MTQGTKLAAVAGILIVGAGIYFVVTPACACLTPDQWAHRFVRSEMARVVDAQQDYLAEHQRYALTLADLSFENASSLSEVRLSAVTDSSFNLEGISVKYPGVTCTRQVSAAAGAESPLECTGHTRR